VDAVGAVGEEVEGELDVDRMVVGLLQDGEHASQIGRDGRLGEEAVEGDPRVVLGGVGEVEVEGVVGGLLDDLGKIEGDELPLLEVEAVHAALAVLAGVVETGLGAAAGCVEGDEAGVVVVAAVDGTGAQAEDEADDAGLGIDVGVPDEGVVGEADAGGLRVVVAALGGTGYAHDEKRHALLAVEQAAALAVAEGLLVEDAGVDAAHGLEEGGHALLARAAVDDEDALVLAEKALPRASSRMTGATM
jgi:hypothetical protein